MQQKKRLVIELRHPVEELKILGDAVKALAQPGLPRQEIQRLRSVIKEAKAYHRLFRAYIQYMRGRVAFLEQQLRQAERGK